MSTHFLQNLYALQESAFTFDEKHTDKKILLLKQISLMPWKNAAQLHAFHEVLLFMAAYPENEMVQQLTTKAFEQIAAFFRRRKEIDKDYADNGYPYTKMVTRFSHDLLRWMNACSECRLAIDSFELNGTDLNTLLRMTLPALERDETTAGLSNEELLDALEVKVKNRLTFLLDECSHLDANPFVKDHLWDELKVWIQITAMDPKFSRAFNRIPQQTIFFQQDILKKFDHESLLKQALPSPEKLRASQRSEVAAVIKKSLILTMRETDPSTYMDESTMRLYALERGISVAIYGMKADRQLPLQSYIGYTLFKNGFPVAYGGSWVFGRSALFGLNIFEAFRGGESGYVMCQLLRVYRYAFSIDHFEVEPYQYGRDNADGIKSGAFWFYYRYGFRPVDRKLYALAEKEQSLIRSTKGYRSSEEVLIQFTEGNIALQGGQKPVKLTTLTGKVSAMIRKEFKGDRLMAVEVCTKRFFEKTGSKLRYTDEQKSVLTDFALLSNALKIEDKTQYDIMHQLIKAKPIDPYQYNQLLIRMFP